MRKARLACGIAIATLVALGAPSLASAACPSPAHTYAVTTKVDENDGAGTGPGPDNLLSLREAILQANADGASSDITLPAGRYKLTLGQLRIAETASCTLTLAGAGARTTTIDGNGAAGVLLNDSGSRATLTGMTVSGGLEGGGILQRGVLTLYAAAVTGNEATDSGGGIHNYLAATLTVLNSTVSGNRASPPDPGSPDRGRGGGIYNEGTATLTNTTVSNNAAGPGTLGDGQGGGVWSSGTLDLVSSTLADNAATGPSTGPGTLTAGGDLYWTGTARKLNSLFSGGFPTNCAPSGSLSSNSSGDKSMSSDATCLPGSGQDLKLGPLVDNGGPTDTRAPLVGSPAVDGGESLCPNDPLFPKRDQRGIPRPQGPRCDVGGVEQVKTANLRVSMTDAPDPAPQRAVVTYTIRVTSEGPPGDATQATLKDFLPAGVTQRTASASQGKCTGLSTITCTLGTLANGSTATILVHVGMPSPGRFTNRVRVTSPRPDATPGDDAASATTTVRAIGTNGNDVLSGTSGPDRICGLFGNDRISGRAGNDKLFGGACTKGAGSLGAARNDGNDTLIGGSGNDLLYGGGGKDRLVGGAGDDGLFGGSGNDVMFGGSGKNVYKAGLGNDKVFANNRRKETIDCGPGKKDFAQVDKSDTVKGCEKVKRVKK